jgi:hypothetical protein
MKKYLKRFVFIYGNYLVIKSVISCILPSIVKVRVTWWRNQDKKLNLKKPLTYNEKLQWLKLYETQTLELRRKCADKLEVRNYVEQKIGKEYLVKLYGVYNKSRDINFAKLPKDIVVKLNHDSGSVLLVKNGKIDGFKLKIMDYCLKTDYSCIRTDSSYSGIKPKIIIEELLQSDDGKTIKDYKVFCFGGKVKIIEVDIDRFEGHKRNLYSKDWEKLDLEIKYPSTEKVIEKPKNIEHLIILSEKLAAPFKHVRVDWYIVNDNFIFGELTFHHSSGFDKFNNYEWEIKMGNWIVLDT